MGKHELKNKKDEGKWNWALLAANVLLTLCFAAVFWPILHKGSLSFLDKTSNLLALADRDISPLGISLHISPIVMIEH